MNKDKVKNAIDHNAIRLSEQLYTNVELGVDWQLKAIERLLKEKKKLSKLYHEIPHVTMDMESKMSEYMKFLNEEICRIINIEYKNNLT